MYARQTQYDQYPDTPELVLVEKPNWITLNKAVELKLTSVSSETLRRMIKRGDVPEGYWMEVPFGDGVIYYIDPEILPALPYKKSGGQEGKRKKKSDG